MILIACCLAVGQSQPDQSNSSQNQTREQSASPDTSKDADSKQESEKTGSSQTSAEAITIPDPSLPPLEGAWQLLEAGTKSDKAGDRAAAFQALGLLTDNSRAGQLAETGLQDDKPDVRSAAAEALGQMNNKSSVPKLEKMLDETDPKVVLSAAHALVEMKNDAGYEVYYEILTGERKSGQGILAYPSAILKDKKRMLALGFHEGLGFVPFGGLSYEAFKMLTKDDVSPLRAAAAKMLASDPDSGSYKALINASGDKNWLVRAAAIDGLARRGDPAALPTVALYMYDEKPEVKYFAGAAVVRLTYLQQTAVKKKPAKKKRRRPR
jgi:HEAT repeat protein